MDHKLYLIFCSIAQQCESRQFRSINVADEGKSNAILAVRRELEILHCELNKARKALREIGSRPHCMTPGCNVDDPMCDAMIARAALE